MFMLEVGAEEDELDWVAVCAGCDACVLLFTLSTVGLLL
jgi:hypothetical protein